MNCCFCQVRLARLKDVLHDNPINGDHVFIYINDSFPLLFLVFINKGNNLQACFRATCFSKLSAIAYSPISRFVNSSVTLKS